MSEIADAVLFPVAMIWDWQASSCVLLMLCMYFVSCKPDEAVIIIIANVILSKMAVGSQIFFSMFSIFNLFNFANKFIWHSTKLCINCIYADEGVGR